MPIRSVVTLLVALGLVAAIGGVTGIATTGVPASYSSSPQGSDSYLAFPSTTAGNDGTVEALDSMNGQVLGSAVAVGVNPGALAVDAPASELFVANSGDGVHSDTTVSVVGTTSWSVTSTVTGLPTGSKPAAATDVPKSLVLVVDNAADDVSVISTSGSSPSLVGNLSLGVSGGQPSSIAVSPDGVYAYVTVPNASDVVVLRYNGSSSNDDFTISRTYNTTNFTPTAIAESPDGDLAYVSNTSTNVIDKFDDSPGKWSLLSSTISLSAAPGSIVAAPSGMLYVAIPSQNKVAFVNTTEASTPVVTYYSRSSTPGGLALNSDSSVLAMASSSTSAAELVNTATGGTAETESSLPNTPSAVATAPTGQTRFFAYVSNYGSGTVSVLDTVTNSVVTTLTVGTGPMGIAVAPDNSAVFVANYGSSTVSVINPADIWTGTNPVVATVSLAASSEPDALAVTPSGTGLLVAEYATGQVQVVDINPSDSSYLQVVPGSSPVNLNGSGSSSTIKPTAVAISPSGQYAYVADDGAAAVSVLVQSGAAGGYSYAAEQASLGLTTPYGIAVAPNGTAAYITDQTSGNGKLWSFPVQGTGSSAGQLNTTGDASVTVGASPDFVALSPEGQTAYVANSGSHTVSVVSVSSFSVTSSPSTGTGSVPTGVAVVPDGSGYLVTNDVSSGSVAALPSSPLVSISVGSTPGYVAFGGDFASPGTVSGPPAGDLAGGASNPSEAWQGSGDDMQQISSSAAFSDSVDTATGAYALRVADLNVPDIGPGLDLAQTYDSSNASVSGPLGYGWAFPTA